MASSPRDESARRRGQMGTAQILYKRVPRELIERPKAGFACPSARAARSAARLGAGTSGTWPPAARRLSGQAVVQQLWQEHLSAGVTGRRGCGHTHVSGLVRKRLALFVVMTLCRFSLVCEVRSN